MDVARNPLGLIVTIDSEAEMALVGQAIAAAVAPGTVVGLVGRLGAGKTRLARSVAEALGADPTAIASPTFVLIHEYDSHPPVYHFDTYRLSGPDEFDDLGPADYFQGEGVCLIEWADRVADRLPADAWWVRIAPLGSSGRRLDITAPDEATIERIATGLVTPGPTINADR